MSATAAPTPRELQQQFFDMLMQSQFWSPEALRDYQRGQLGQLLRHARASVPFYERRLDVLFRPNGEIDWERWSEVPIVTRRDLAEQGNSLLAKRVPMSHGRNWSSTTSGTSGVPITLISSELAYRALGANMYRAYRWHGIDTSHDCCRIYGDDPNEAKLPHGQTIGPWGPPWDPASQAGKLVRINRLAPYDQMLDFIVKTKPDYLTTGPKVAFVLAREALRLGREIRLDAILPHGAAVEATDRAAFREAFGARTAELYSSKEAGQIAHGCPDGEGLHVNAESVLVEIVDGDGRPVAPGMQGRVVVTPFFNSAQPLIRYDQGDFASWMPECSCGRHLPRLNGLIGRSTTVFYHPDGRARPAFMGAQRSLLRCTAWQVAQTGPRQFAVRYVPIDPRLPGDEAGLAARMRELYFDDAEVTFHRVDAIAIGANGKQPEYVNEWRPPA